MNRVTQSIKHGVSIFRSYGIMAAILISVILQVVLYFKNRPFFLDSLNLARNLCDRSYLGLSNPLDYEQSAPLGFLWLSELMTNLFGFNEHVLRFLPLVFGIVSIILFSKLVNHFLKKPWGFMAVLWLGSHFMYVRYATEFKQYILDAMITIIIILLAIKYKELNRNSVILWSVVGSIFLWFSMPSVFVLASVCVYLGVYNFDKDKSFLHLLLVGVAWLFSFILNYFLILRPIIESTHMQDFHSGFFLDLNVFDTEVLSNNWAIFEGYARMVVGKSGIAIGLFILAITAAFIDGIMNKNKMLLLLVLPIAFAKIASIFNMYSLLERLMLFSLPLSVILLFKGIDVILKLISDKNKYVNKGIKISLCVILVSSFYSVQSFKYLKDPLLIEDNRSPIDYISKGDHASSLVICSQHAYPSLDFYSNCALRFPSEKLRGLYTSYGSDLIKEVERQLNSEEEVWLYLAHVSEQFKRDTKKKLEKMVEIKKEYHSKGSVVLLIQEN